MNYDELDKFLQSKQQEEIVVSAKDYFSQVELPESWPSLESFIDWYLDSRMPLAVPWNSTMALTDNTTSVPLFRKFPYLVELHLVHPGCSIPEHCHPGTEVVIMMMGGGNNTITEWGEIKKKLSPGEYHKLGDVNKTNEGLVYMSFSKWPDGWLEKNKNYAAGIMTQWQGDTTGPVHDQFINKYTNKEVYKTLESSIDLDAEPTISTISSTEFFKDIVIPETWDTIEDFTGWWIKNKMPLMIPKDAEVIISDDATAICVFKHGRFQIEFYIIKPHYSIESHCHPGMEVMTIYFGGGSNSLPGPETFHNTATRWGRIRKKLNSGEYHGGEDTAIYSGFVLVAIQKWDEGIPMTSAAINWKGTTAGPLQEALIKKHRPDVFVEPGYADITRIT